MIRAGQVLQRFRELPFADFAAVSGGATIMVLAPHPDDESLGCGGLIAEACRRGCPPIVVIVSDGAASHPASLRYPPDRLRAVRQHEARNAVTMLGLPLDRLHFLGLPDTAVPAAGAAFERVVTTIMEIALTENCKIVCGSWAFDPHGDHMATNMIARSVAKATKMRLLTYPVWGWLLEEHVALPTQLPRGWRLNIAAHLAAKKRAILAHVSQYGDLIDDDPTGFKLPKALLATFEADFEVFIEES